MSTPNAIDVVLDDRQRDHEIDADAFAVLLAAALNESGVVPPAEVGLAFIGIDEMTELNTLHMGGSGPTDVLAFPLDGASVAPGDQPSLVGDVVVCPAVASKAPQSLDDELALLVVHGALHLTGHDHREPQETAEMKRREVEILAKHRGPSDASRGDGS